MKNGICMALELFDLNLYGFYSKNNLYGFNLIHKHLYGFNRLQNICTVFNCNLKRFEAFLNIFNALSL